MTERDALLFANEAFYRAFADRDMAAMDRLWLDSDAISVVHPGWHPIEGRESVLETWEAILTGPSPPDIECISPHAALLGDTGIVICYEKIGSDYLAATNVFVRDGRTWRLVHHQAGYAPGAPDDPTDTAGNDNTPIN